MVSSGGGGTPRAPNMPAPAGTSVPYGQASTPISGPPGVLPNSGPMTMDQLTAAWESPGWAAAFAPPPPPPAAAAGAPTSLDAYAQSLMDWRKQNQPVAMMRGTSFGNAAQAMRSMPAAQGPAQQLMRQQMAANMQQALRDRQAAVQRARGSQR